MPDPERREPPGTLTMAGTATLADARELGATLFDLTDDTTVADVGRARTI